MVGEVTMLASVVLAVTVVVPAATPVSTAVLGELSRRLVMHLHGEVNQPDFVLLVNGGGAIADFVLPKLPATRTWHRVVDTALPSPHDFTDPDDAPRVPAPAHYPMHAQSVALLITRDAAAVSPDVPGGADPARS